MVDLKDTRPSAKRARTDDTSVNVHGAEASASAEQQTNEAAGPSQQQHTSETFGASPPHTFVSCLLHASRNLLTLLCQEPKLISRFRCGCHGLHVDTGRLLPLAQQVPREQRHCVFCTSGSAEDEHHFVFDCPAYCAIRNRSTNIFWGPAPTLSSFFTLHDPKVIASLLRECFEHRNTLMAAQTGHNL